MTEMDSANHFPHRTFSPLFHHGDQIQQREEHDTKPQNVTRISRATKRTLASWDPMVQQIVSVSTTLQRNTCLLYAYRVFVSLDVSQQGHHHLIGSPDRAGIIVGFVGMSLRQPLTVVRWFVWVSFDARKSQSNRIMARRLQP